MPSKDLSSFLEKNRNKKIVFTNGCFDILHRGHLLYLKEAKSLGDILIVGLNSDASVKKLDKSDNRPINNEDDRKLFLESLKSVDFVEIFDEETPYNLIAEVLPNILVKGGDWSPDQIVGSDVVLKEGGKVLSLKFVDGHSTTSFIKKLQGMS